MQKTINRDIKPNANQHESQKGCELGGKEWKEQKRSKNLISTSPPERTRQPSIPPRQCKTGCQGASWGLKTMQNWLLRQKHEQKHHTQCLAETGIQTFAEQMN